MEHASSWLFKNGFGFMVPYVAVYLAGRVFDVPVAGLRLGFIALHGVHMVLLTTWVVPRLRHVDVRLMGFWMVLAALFILPGAYLEYPSDPWEHVRRIYEWSTVERLDDHGTAGKFAYFWGWTWLGALPISARPAGLAAYSAFWQLLLAWQFYRLARALGFSRGWSAAQVVGTVALFGTNLFGFYRYYALSSTPLAYIAYLYGVGRILEPAGPAWSRVAAVGVAAAVAWANHDQEVLFLALAVFAVLAFEWTSRLSAPGRRLAAATAAAVVLGGLAFGAWLRARHPEFYAGHVSEVSVIGTYRIWDPWTVFFETLGLHGVLAMAATGLVRYRRPRLALLTWLPVLLLSFPPFVLFTAQTFPTGYIVYRVLYLFPTSFALVAAVETLAAGVVPRAAVAIGLAVISLIPAWPLRGRLYFQLYVPPAANRLTHLYPVAIELARHATWSRDCLIVSDRITNFFLTAHLGLRLNVRRFGPDELFERWAAGPSLDVYTGKGEPAPVCAAVLLRPDQIPPSPGSAIGRSSRHWTEREAAHHAWVRADTSAIRQRLHEPHWRPIGSARWLNSNAVALGLVTTREASPDLQR